MQGGRLVVLVAGLSVALAGAPAPAQVEAGPCAKDVERLCPKVEAGPALRECLQKQRQADLSMECRSWIGKRRERRREFRQACAKDAQTFCADAGAGSGRVRRCLQEHQAEISSACRDVVNEIADEATEP